MYSTTPGRENQKWDLGGTAAQSAIALNRCERINLAALRSQSSLVHLAVLSNKSHFNSEACRNRLPNSNNLLRSARDPSQLADIGGEIETNEPRSGRLIELKMSLLQYEIITEQNNSNAYLFI